jgi:hypothetical protein
MPWRELGVVLESGSVPDSGQRCQCWDIACEEQTPTDFRESPRAILYFAPKFAKKKKSYTSPPISKTVLLGHVWFPEHNLSSQKLIKYGSYKVRLRN